MPSAENDALFPRFRRAISNAYYDARNAGRTMEQAADAAAADCEEVVKAWLAEHASNVIPPGRPMPSADRDALDLLAEWYDWWIETPGAPEKMPNALHDRTALLLIDATPEGEAEGTLS